MSTDYKRHAPVSPSWIPLMDYAMRRGVSLSTLRRQIKAKKIPFRIEGGKYLVLLESDQTNIDTPPPAHVALAVEQFAGAHDEYTKLKTDLQRAREEIAELKTLIALYEELPPDKSTGF